MTNSAKSQFTRQALCDAFCLLHAKMPIKQISVTAVAKKAGVDRTTFYQYFLDIDDLANTVETEFVDFVITHRTNITVRDRDFDELLVQAYHEQQLPFTALLGPFGDLTFIEQLTKRLNVDLPEVQRTRLQPYLSEYHLMTTLSLFRLWLARGQDIPIEELMQLTRQLYLHGIQGTLAD